MCFDEFFLANVFHVDFTVIFVLKLDCEIGIIFGLKLNFKIRQNFRSQIKILRFDVILIFREFEIDRIPRWTKNFDLDSTKYLRIDIPEDCKGQLVRSLRPQVVNKEIQLQWCWS